VLPLHRRLLVPIVVFATAGVCALGCGRMDKVPAAPVKMRIGVGIPPAGAPGSGAGTVIKLLMSDPWLTNRADGRQTERIATGWTWDESGTTLRLKLRSDVYFHDGTLLTPEIAAEALRLTVADAARQAFSFTSVTSVMPSGPDTVDLKLRGRNTLILPDLSGVLVVKPHQPKIGTGPFQIVNQTDAQDAVLSAFPRYYRGHPSVAEIDVTNYPTQRKAWAALMRGEIDMLHEVSRDAAEFVEAETTVRTYSFPRPYYIPLVFSARHPILKQVEVRKAINEALDRTTLIRNGLSGRGMPSDGPVWPLHWAYSPLSQPFVFSPDSARRRLDSAGVRARAMPGSTVPSRFSFTCLAFAGDTRFERLAVLVQKQLADVDIDMKILPLPQDQLVERFRKGDFDAFLFEMAGRSLSWVYEFWRSHDGIMNNTGYRSADAVLDRIRGARSDDEVRAGVAELERVMHDDPPAAFIAWQATSRAVSTKFDVAPEENRDILTNVWQWRPADAPKRASR
jgi:ABC-type transport system substrate-binding protein